MDPLTLPGVVTDWQFAPLASTALTLLAGAWLAAVWLEGRRHPAGP